MAKSVTLSTGRKCKIKEMSVDDVDYCTDLTVVRYEDNEPVAITGMSKARTTWIRKGLEGGSFKGCSFNSGVPDSALRQLSETEKNELALEIQEYQRLGEETPSD